MGDETRLPTLEDLKDQARRLRDALARQGTTINHSRSLELIASQYGFRDWNTLHAKIGNQPPKRLLSLGDRATGRYLGARFAGKVIAIQRLTNAPGYDTCDLRLRRAGQRLQVRKLCSHAQARRLHAGRGGPYGREDIGRRAAHGSTIAGG